jgi:hypothetical protein
MSSYVTQVSTHHTVAARSKYVAGEPETVNRNGLHVTKSLEASPAPKKLEVGGLKGPQKTGVWKLCHPWVWGYLISSWIIHEYVRRSSVVVHG